MNKRKYRYVLLLTVLLSALVYLESCFTKQNGQKYLFVDSDSMLPAIHPGDYVVDDSIIGSLNYGDIVRFERVGEFTGEPYIDVSRVVGLPGDSVGLVNNIVYINGRICDSKYIGTTEYTYKNYNQPFSFAEYEETQSSALKINIFTRKYKGTADRDNANVSYVPADHYYLIGDNRIMAMDSRFDGPYHKSKIIGKIVKVKSMR